jgi:hypothetical protein
MILTAFRLIVLQWQPRLQGLIESVANSTPARDELQAVLVIAPLD